MPNLIPPGTSLDANARMGIDALLKLFRAAVRDLTVIEQQMREGTYRRSYLQAQLREARDIVERLVAIKNGRITGEIAVWARENLVPTYQYGAGLAVRDLREQLPRVTAGSARIHTRALAALLDQFMVDTTSVSVQLHANVIRAGRVVLGRAGFGQDIANGIISGAPRREISRQLLKTLAKAAGPDAMDLTHVEINSRRLRVDAWAEMHARTELARTSTAGTRVLSATNGVGHVQITTHSHPPCICSPFEGRIYSIEPGDPEFPWIGDVPNGGCPMHPNCVHREAPAVIELLRQRGELEGRATIPEDFRGLSTRELARLVYRNRDQIAQYSESRTGFMPADFKLMKAAA